VIREVLREYGWRQVVVDTVALIALVTILCAFVVVGSAIIP
jgi:hypothetical protein